VVRFLNTVPREALIEDTITADSADIRTVAMLGNHLPRQCGIATFTTDLSDALAAQVPELDCFVVAMNDPAKHYAYLPRVRFEIDEADHGAYRRAADFLNVNSVDVLSVQHEYGIFGGKAGCEVLTLLREMRMPIVTTLHTILAEPNAVQRSAMQEIVKLSERLIVMTTQGADLLRKVHGVPIEKIDVIPHGIPNVPSNGHKKNQLGVQGRSVILTFGLLSPDKGIELVIDAMPAILARFPETVYMVLGATHPHVKDEHGETYRLMLESRAERLGVGGNVIFHNRFVSRRELMEFLSVADIYVTPYLKAEQSTSGTLAYAIGSGKAVISTPYWHAKELLADGRGILIPFRDSAAIAREAIDLLGDHSKRSLLGDQARAYARDMAWPSVAKSYMRSFERARVEHVHRRHTTLRAKTLTRRQPGLPEINLEHVRLLTDQTGMVQHADFNVPRYRDGYCLDDNARALLLMALVEEDGAEDKKAVRALASRYLAFASDAFNPENGRFRNFMSYARRWIEERGSEDSHGRALWALGAVVGRSTDPGRHSLSGRLFHSALPAVSQFTSPRAWAFALLGIDEYLRAFRGDIIVTALKKTLSERLFHLFQRTSAPEWPWFEDRVTYSNARLSQALIVAGGRGDEAMAAAGLRSLDWLLSIQTSKEGYFAPIGSNGFYERTGQKPLFDQQPVEACGAISACLDAHRLTQDARWLERARHIFSWFSGWNQLQQPLYDATTGGCRDGLHADRANENEGAESTLSYLIALLELRLAERADSSRSAPRAAIP
jgi:glycosyltransferase involved in cell wall biosynthesis